ncbi:MAG: filamentous hemagglutinin N-terminal domain-containing protein [Gammaproteobacteria bacterium]
MFIEHKQLFHWRRAVHNGREIAYCRRLIAGVMLLTASTLVVEAAPTGGSVVQGPGAATITQTPDGSITTIDQTAMRVDIDWTGFDTTAGQAVNFDQPGAAALAVNRIGGNRTRFDGTLNANGRVFLINQNGITFGATAQVNAGSLLATTSQLVGSSAAPESHSFSGTGYGSIINEGDITVSDGGFAVLAAPHVENNGLIKADLGQVELASTKDFTIEVDLRGDGLITFASTGEWLEGESNPLGATSTGTLQAKSGHIYLTANMASEIVQGTVNLSGIVDADQFVSTPDGGLEMVASAAPSRAYPGGTIKVESAGDINIGGGADIHAIGGETVTASFHADRDINMGADGDPARIVLKAASTADDSFGASGTAHAAASLEMIAAAQGGAGTLTIADGSIEVTADAVGTTGSPPLLATAAVNAGATSAAATVVMEAAEVDINADFAVHARAETLDSGQGTPAYGSDNTDALAVLDVIANGEIEYDTSGNVLRYGTPGDLTLVGDIDVSAGSTTVNSATSKATANTLLVATGSTDVTGGINVDAVATSRPGLYPAVSSGSDAADANAALVMLGGTPPGLLDLLREVSLNRIDQLGTLSDMLTLANLDDVLAVFGGLLSDPVTFVNRRGGIGSGSVSYTGDSNVSALADYGTTGAGQGGPSGLSEATAAGYFAAGGDVYINTDPVRVSSRANANYDDSAGGSGNPLLDTEARSFLVAAAGLGDLLGNSSAGTTYSTLTVLGDLTARAQEQASLNGVPDPASYNQLAAAVTALLASGDITVRGADPLADAAPAFVQGRSSKWQLCYQGQCTPLNAGIDGLVDLAAASAGNNGTLDSAHLAQLIIESLHGEIDIQPKVVTDIQPAGLFTDPVGPIWPGDLPLRFDANGRMLVATGTDATRPPQIVALGSSIESAILAGGDPGTLLPPTASGGCIVAGRDAFTISSPDYFDRMISVTCETGN